MCTFADKAYTSSWNDGWAFPLDTQALADTYCIAACQKKLELDNSALIIRSSGTSQRMGRVPEENVLMNKVEGDT